MLTRIISRFWSHFFCRGPERVLLRAEARKAELIHGGSTPNGIRWLTHALSCLITGRQVWAEESDSGRRAPAAAATEAPVL